MVAKEIMVQSSAPFILDDGNQCPNLQSLARPEKLVISGLGLADRPSIPNRQSSARTGKPVTLGMILSFLRPGPEKQAKL